MKNNRFNSLLGSAWRRFYTPSGERGGSITALEILLALLVAVLFCGCGGAPGRTPGSSASASSSAPQAPTALGNWQFTATSTVPGKAPLTFAGSIGQAGDTISSALHVGGSNCFDPVTTLNLTGTVTADSTSLTSAAIDGQVVTLTGTFDDFNYYGTYRINGGCAAGQQGSLTGINVSNIGNDLSGTFTNSAQRSGQDRSKYQRKPRWQLWNHRNCHFRHALLQRWNHPARNISLRQFHSRQLCGPGS
jgi:hypothetical protein